MIYEDLKDKVVLVTGASRGIGRALAVRFAEEGATVVANYNSSEEAANELKDEMSAKGCNIDLIKADVSSATESEKMIDIVVEKYSGMDILVNNAGIRKDMYLAMMSEDDWDDVIDTNLKSIYHLCKWTSRAMISKRSGIIINVSSVSALRGVGGQTNYSASKGGMLAFTRSLADELAPYGIRVNAVAPGFIETDMTKDMDELINKMLPNIPLGRIGTPEDVCGGVLFLASEDSNYITGFTLAIDGGIT